MLKEEKEVSFSKMSAKIIKVVFKNVEDTEKDVADCLNLLNLKLKEEKSVMIKPNLVSGAPPGQSISTNVHVINAVIKWLKSKGIHKITVADGSSTINTTKEFKKARYDLLDAPFVDLNHDGYVKIRVNKALEWPAIEVAKTFYNASYVINMPVAKCHHISGATLGIKNLVGVLRPLGKNNVKDYIHEEWTYSDMPKNKAKELFERRLIDLLRVKHIDLTVLDGTYGLQGYESGKEVVKTRFLVASDDVIAADMLSARVIGFGPDDIYHIKLAQQVLGSRRLIVAGDKPRFFNFKKSPLWLKSK